MRKTGYTYLLIWGFSSSRSCPFFRALNQISLRSLLCTQRVLGEGWLLISIIRRVGMFMLNQAPIHENEYLLDWCWEE